MARQCLKNGIIDEIATSAHRVGDSTIAITSHYVIPPDQKTVPVPAYESAVKMNWHLRSRGEQRMQLFAFLWRNHLIEPVLADNLFLPPPCQL